jgi:steroid delta-isomerase-like uncharacterized protein
MSIEIKNVAGRIFEEVWNQRNRGVIDQLITIDYVHHDGHAVEVRRGIERYKKFVSLYLDAFSDLRFTIEDELSADDKIVTRWIVTGTHDGDLPGLPRTGRSISLSGITIARVIDGKVAESWNNWDVLGMMQQLGAAPADAQSQAA